MSGKKIWIYIAVLLVIPATISTAALADKERDAEQLNGNQKEILGMKLFFDKSLSTPSGQACAACHGPAAGYTGPESETNAAGAVYEGAVKGRFGNRKPPTAAYAGDSPILHYDSNQGTWIGGMFWDGRATGRGIYPNDPLAE
ncbi:MAG TPA: cytochrome-c peroxidase, partial [Candidatus Methanoperedens sp.]